MEIKINIDESCKHCKEGLVYLKKLYKRNKNAYGSFILHPISRLIKEKRDLGEEDKINGINLIPDYNSSGYLTHFHIEENRNKLKTPICPACKKPMTNAIDTITKKISQYLWECDCDEFKGMRLCRG